MRHSIRTAIALILVLTLFPVTAVRAVTQEEALQEKIDEIVAGMPFYFVTDYQRALYLHDYIVDHVVYGETSNDQTAYGALVEGEAVCAGYADAYRQLLNAVGIEAATISGIANNGVSMEAHAWSMVWLDGKCYFTDVTWDDPISETGDVLSHAYFNLTLEQISLDHFADSSFDDVLPDVCNHTGMDFYTMSVGPGTGIGIVTPDSAMDTVAAYFAVAAFDGTVVTYTCDLRFDGVDPIAWYEASYAALGTELGLNGFQVSISGVGTGYTMIFQGEGTPPHIHDDPLECISGAPASCTEPGMADYYHCTGCGALYFDQNGKYPVTDMDILVLAAPGHKDQNQDDLCDTCGTKLTQDPPPTETTAPTIQPTEPSTEPTTAPTTQPTEPSTEPTTAPTTQPTEPSTEPTTAPTTQPTEPSMEPTTAPATQPTEPSTEPTTAPTTQPTEPSAEHGTAPSTVPAQTIAPGFSVARPTAVPSQGTAPGASQTEPTQEPEPVTVGDIRVYIAIGAVAVAALAAILTKKHKK